MSSFSFEYPFAFLLLVVLFISMRWFRQERDSLFFPNLHLLEQASRQNRYALNTLKVLIALGMITALASPITQNSVQVQNNEGYELSLVLDASGSMQQNNKFGIVKAIVQDFLQKRPHDKIGMTLFADFAYVAVPLTYDKKSVEQLLSRLEVGVAGMQRTALYEALFLSSNLFKKSTSKHKVAILLTDGIDNANSIPLDIALATLQKYGIKVYTIGIGGPRDYDGQVLEKIATQSGGKFFQARSVERLKEVYEIINSLEKSEIQTNKYVKKEYFFYLPLLMSVVLLTLFVFLRQRQG